MNVLCSMKKQLLLFALGLSLTSSAQFHYELSSTNQTYEPLTSGATQVNTEAPWLTTSFIVELPFIYHLNGLTFDTYSIFWGTGLTPSSDTTSTIHLEGFSPMDAWLMDKGNLTGSSISPIRYRIDGTSPSRIFKLEYFNTGFLKEAVDSGTVNDSLNLQMWLYETSDIIEMHYGGSQVTYPQEYFFNGSQPFISYIKNLDPSTGTGRYYYLVGDATNPQLDSANLGDLQPGFETIDAFPSNGQVYRFTPTNTASFARLNSADVRVYPTITSGWVNITSIPNGNYKYRLIQIQGKETGISGNLTSGSNQINCSGLESGIYLLTLTDEISKSRINYKIVKK